MGRLWQRLGGSGSRMLDRCRDVVDAANALEPSVRSRSDADLHASVVELRRCHADAAQQGELLPQAAALVRETARRTLGQRLDDVQIMGGVALHHGSMVEMKTGEGKTLTIVLPAFLGALGGRGVHVMTANAYLATRDASGMGPVYQQLGLSSRLLAGEDGPQRVWQAQHRAAFAADVTYGVAEAFAYSYLRDQSAWDEKETVQRGRCLAIVDEADLVMIDDARQTPGITAPKKHTGPDYPTMTALARRLRTGVHYTVDPARKLVTLTGPGIERMEDLLGTSDLYNSAGSDLLRTLDSVLLAKEVYRRDLDYLVEDGVIRLVDGNTGRFRVRGTFSSGLMQALAVKEGLEVPEERQTLASVSTHMYLRGYEKLSAITGVATETGAYRRIYGLETVLVPTGRPVRRVDRPVAVYTTEAARLAAAVDRTAERHGAGQPVLLGTRSIAQAEQVSAALRDRGIGHEVLTAKNHAVEAEVIARAGGVGAVTVVTRMVGRGVDIPLGGADAAERDAVLRSGGLHVLALDLYENRRLELHMRGRAGRRGDPGTSEVFASQEDRTLTRLFTDRTLALVRRLSGSTDLPISDAVVTRQLERLLDTRTAQWEEQLCAAVRYDEVRDAQCDRIYRLRRALLAHQGVREWIAAAVAATVERYVRTAVPGPDDAERLHRALAELYPISLSSAALAGFTAGAGAAPPWTELAAAVRADIQAAYERREASLSSSVMRELERRVCLSVIDRAWREQLDALSDLMAGTTLHSLTGSDPLAHYQLEAQRLFTELSERIEQEAVGYLFNLEVEVEQQQSD